MHSPDSLYQQLQKIGTSPALTVYGEDRIELSGKVLANHIAKIANFLVDEVELEPGDRVVLDLPLHWKTFAWALAALVAGGNVVVGREKIADAEPGTVVVTSRPHGIELDSGDTVVALPLGSLALSWAGELDPGVYDGAADVMSFPDSLLFSGLGDESNASFYANAVPHVPQGRIGLVSPSVIEAISVGYSTLSSGNSLVIVGATSTADSIFATEHAESFTPPVRI